MPWKLHHRKRGHIQTLQQVRKGILKCDNMNNEKLHNYDIWASVHTVSFRNENENLLKGDDYVVKGRDPGMWIHKNNPNKVAICDNLNSLYLALDEINDGNPYTITRVDMALDSDQLGQFEEYRKFNRYLIALLINAYRVNNSFESRSILELKNLSTCAKNKYFEIENYDKQEESNKKSFVTGRLEIRSKCLNDKHDIECEFSKAWMKRFNKAISEENRDITAERMNSALIKAYKPGMNLKDFVMYYGDCIFTSKQLIELLKEIGYGDGNVRKRAHNLKQRAEIELYSQHDLIVILDKIKTAINNFCMV